MNQYTFTLSYGDSRASVRLAESATLYNLAETLLTAIGFEFDHAFGFHSDLKSPYAENMEREYTLFADQGEGRMTSDTGVEKTTIREVFKEGDTLLFHFDYGNDWQFPVQCTAIEPSKSRKRKPEILEVVGEFPEQYPSYEEDDFDEEIPVGVNSMTGERIELNKARKSPNKLPDYLQALEIFSRPFPKAAVEEALDKKEESVLLLLDVLRSLPGRVRKGEIADDYVLHEYSMHLLAELRETAAYRPLVEIARMPEIDELIGDGVTEDLPKILAALWDGDSEPLFSLIGDKRADEFARGAGVHALGNLRYANRLSRAELSAAALHIYQNCLERRYGFVWDAWILLVSDFRLTEFADQISQVYRKGFADPGFQSEKSALKTLRAAADTERLARSYKAYTTAVEEVSSWVCFSEREVQREIREAATRDSEWLEDDDYDDNEAYALPSHFPAPETFVRDRPKVGRNDPCPCGSGKKYKKCCLEY